MDKDGRLTINLLGTPEVWLDGRLITSFSTAKTSALLYYLATTGQLHSREALAGLLWGEMPEDKARRNLTKSLTVLRRLLAPFLLIEPQQVGFLPGAAFELDIRLFSTAVSSATIPLDDVSPDDVSLDDISLYRGDFLEGFHVKDALAFEDWQLALREHFRDLAIGALDKIVENAASQGDYETGIRYGRRLLELDPWREPAHRQLMLMFARTGRLGAALVQYELCRQVLAQELGLDPSAETTALFHRIQSARDKPAFDLPFEATPMVGREQELAQTQTLLANPSCRLVTITGLGGIGKTRLAQAAARRANRETELLFLNGVAFINLADLSSESAMPLTIANALDVPFTRANTVRRALIHFLRSKEMLLVLDNLEQFLDQLDVLLEILRSCPDIKLLVTSREALNVTSEWRIDLEGLPVPQEEETEATSLASYAAVELFNRTAVQVKPAYKFTAQNAEIVTRLCRLVGGMPLALRLAATWLRAMPLTAILAAVEHDLDILATEMRDIPDRQRSIRAIFESTWKLLSKAEQEVLELLSVCRGGFDQQAAEAIAQAGPFLLRQIIDRALLGQQGESRYAMHPLIHQYAGEKLKEDNQQEIASAKHGRYYLAWLAEKEPELYGSAPHLAAKTVKEELDNVERAWLWAAQNKETGQLRASLSALAAFFELIGLLPEGLALIDTAIETLDPPWNDEEKQLLCRLFLTKGQFSSARGTYDLAEAALDQAEELLEGLDDEDALAGLHMARGHVLTYTGDYVTARAEYQQALSMYRRMNDERKIADALAWLGWIFIVDDMVDQAIPILQEALAIERAIGHRRGEANAQGSLTVALSIHGDFAEARQNQEEVLAIYEELGDRANIVRTKNNIGMSYMDTGRYLDAQPYISQAIRLAEEIGATPERANALDTLGTAYLGAGQYARAQACLEEAHQSAVEIGYTYLDLSAKALLVKTRNRAGQIDRSQEGLPEFRELAERLENSFYIARALAEEAYISFARQEVANANQLMNQAIAIIRQHSAQADLPAFLLQQAGYHLEQSQPEAAWSGVEEALAIAERLQHQPLLFLAKAMGAALSQILNNDIEAAAKAQAVLGLLPGVSPVPDVLTGLYYLSLYRLSLGDEETALLGLAFVAAHPATDFMTRRLAQRLETETTPIGPSSAPVSATVEWQELIAQLA